MAITAPAYDINEVVYLRESAALGFIEAVRITGVHKYKDGWVYTIGSRVSGPQHAAVYGDRISHVHGQTLYFSEDELVSHCDALILAEANATNNLQRIQSQRIAICPIEPTAGTD